MNSFFIPFREIGFVSPQEQLKSVHIPTAGLGNLILSVPYSVCIIKKRGMRIQHGSKLTKQPLHSHPLTGNSNHTHN